MGELFKIVSVERKQLSKAEAEAAEGTDHGDRGFIATAEFPLSGGELVARKVTGEGATKAEAYAAAEKAALKVIAADIEKS